MSSVTTLTGVPGILRPFKEYLTGKNLAAGSQIAYYGCVGTCTPFVELLAYATRDMNLSHLFVPLFDESNARILKNVPGVGMQTGDPVDVKPEVIVLMGGACDAGRSCNGRRRKSGRITAWCACCRCMLYEHV